MGNCAPICRNNDFSIGSSTSPILTASTAGATACYMCIRVNGTAYKIALLNA